MKHNTTLAGFGKLSLLAIGALSSIANAQVINGSFESGAAYFPNSPNINLSGTPSPWVATSFTPDCYDNTGADGWNLGGIPAYNGMFKGMLAQQGNRFIGFAAGQTFNESFKETLLPLTPGGTYTVSAFMSVDDLGKAVQFGGPYSGRGMIDVKINGSSVGTFAPNTASLTWQLRSVTFVAPNASTFDLEFVALQDPATHAPSYLGIDNVEMVPEPATMASLGLGLAALLSRRVRQRS